jgi:hypothetical protein
MILALPKNSELPKNSVVDQPRAITSQTIRPSVNAIGPIAAPIPARLNGTAIPAPINAPAKTKATARNLALSTDTNAIFRGKATVSIAVPMAISVTQRKSCLRPKRGIPAFYPTGGPFSRRDFRRRIIQKAAIVLAVAPHVDTRNATSTVSANVTARNTTAPHRHGKDVVQYRST